ncbi:hypothetical protein QLF87_23025, partial [Salmonella enterica subsp. enterica serovar Oslo]
MFDTIFTCDNDRRWNSEASWMPSMALVEDVSVPDPFLLGTSLAPAPLTFRELPDDQRGMLLLDRHVGKTIQYLSLIHI